MRKTINHLILTSILLLGACVTTVTGGHIKEDEALSSIKIGVTSKEETRKLLGSPSSESSFGPTTWLYISNVKHTRSLLPTQVVDQRVTEIAFDTGGVVHSVKEYTLSDGKKVQVAERTTPTEGQQLGFIEQVVGNLGRFNKDDGSSSDSPINKNNRPPPVVR